MNDIYLSLGTNIEPREKHLHEALHMLKQHETIDILEKSSIYETDPVGYLEQADFLNMVIQIDTSLLPIELLNYCQHIEQQLGRQREIRFGPRTIDLDLLLYRQEVIDTKRLIVPHPRMHKRAFVLVPLHELAADFLIPTMDVTVQELLKQLDSSMIDQVRLWDDQKRI